MQLLGDLMFRAVLFTIALVTTACASTKGTPNPFNRWGNVSPVSEPYRAPIVAAVRSVPSPETGVLARYAGDTRLRFDLAPLLDDISMAVDIDTQLAEIDNGPAARRARAFAKVFPGKTTILVAEIPDLHDTWATMTLWIWDARAWECWLPGKVEHITLSRVHEDWRVSSIDVKEGMSLAQTDCE